MESDTIASHHAGFLPPVSLMGPAGTRGLWERREGAAWGVAGGHAVTVQASQKVSIPDGTMMPPQSFNSAPPAMPAKEPEPGPRELQLAPEALLPSTVQSAADPMQPTLHLAPASLTEEADSGGSKRKRADQVHNSSQDTLSTFFESKESVQGLVRYVSLHRSPAVEGSDDGQQRTGIGIVFGRTGLEATSRGHWKILQVLPNGTAFQSGLIAPGLTLLAVDGRAVGDLVNPSGV